MSQMLAKVIMSLAQALSFKVLNLALQHRQSHDHVALLIALPVRLRRPRAVGGPLAEQHPTEAPRAALVGPVALLAAQAPGLSHGPHDATAHAPAAVQPELHAEGG